MTLHRLYMWAKQELTKAELESPAFDAVCLLSDVFGIDRHGLLIHGERVADPQLELEYCTKVRRRAAREPLQYIIGKWTFMGMSFSVGQGVLIPREDTQTLVEEGIRLARALEHRPVIYDLCAGSGAVAAGIVQSVPEADLWCFEISDDALLYLRQNLNIYAPGAHILRMDVLTSLPASDVPKPDIILSNPPYIPTDDLDTLSPEVKKEPVQALDGGLEGLIFYRAIAQKWSRLLPAHGSIAVEIGIGQAKAVCEIFAEQGMSINQVLTDINGLERVVSAYLKKNLCSD